MTTVPNDNPNRPDPFGGYLAGAREAVDAVRPDEPSEDQWRAVLGGVRVGLAAATEPARVAPPRWHRTALAAGAAALAAVAAAVVWVSFAPVVNPAGVTKSGSVVPARPEPPADPLAGFDVLPLASAEEVDLHRVPGSGWLPVGHDPLPAAIVLATNQDIELDYPDSTWSQVTPSPGDAPVIFASKPR
ncbi:hypothetical protein R5W23_000221 [Gemmata sp. JC673]|uniref:Uncharacterized protein n=1 Tax=Gemmata algarum TaxID=2975278 RepID=A0ABU5ERT2_9BACT|nr:hypothetical protein [Gemmata algarum]MDY3557693.1 hypothetical protein [Gemmata algarum]